MDAEVAQKMLGNLDVSDDFMAVHNDHVQPIETVSDVVTLESKLFSQGVLQPLLDFTARTGALDAVDLCNLSCVSKSATCCIDWSALKGLLPKFIASAARPNWAVVPKGRNRRCQACGLDRGNLESKIS